MYRYLLMQNNMLLNEASLSLSSNQASQQDAVMVSKQAPENLGLIPPADVQDVKLYPSMHPEPDSSKDLTSNKTEGRGGDPPARQAPPMKHHTTDVSLSHPNQAFTLPAPSYLHGNKCNSLLNMPTPF
jgi:hypothetical protein